MSPPKSPPPTETPSLPSEQHRRVVAAVKELFRLSPTEAARWIRGRCNKPEKTVPPDEVVEAQWIEQAPRGPAYVVPAPRVEEARPLDAEELMAQVFASALEKEVAASEGKLQVKTVNSDFSEAVRQTILEGGGDIELRLETRRPSGESLLGMLGVVLPDEHEDGTMTHWNVQRVCTWQLIVYRKLIGETVAISTVPLYLWPGTGLKDTQEDCSVIKGDLNLPGVLGALFKSQDPEQRARELSETRKWNLSRLERQERLDKDRRAAAARRFALTGKEDITDEQLRAILPDIDLDKDRITMILNYDILRLWEEPLDELLVSLPPVCMGLALFGWRPSEMSMESALERCAFTLRRALRDAPADEIRRASLGLAAIASALMDPEAVRGLLRKTKLL